MLISRTGYSNWPTLVPISLLMILVTLPHRFFKTDRSLKLLIRSCRKELAIIPQLAMLMSIPTKRLTSIVDWILTQVFFLYPESTSLRQVMSYKSLFSFQVRDCYFRYNGINRLLRLVVLVLKSIWTPF